MFELIIPFVYDVETMHGEAMQKLRHMHPQSNATNNQHKQCTAIYTIT